MGTSSACMWATIYYAVHEVSTLLPIYENNLIQLVRFIDDMFGVFVPNNDINANYIQDHSTIQFQEFVNDLTFGNLEWDDIVYGDSLNFLDLNISIDSTNRIVTKSYQKPLNLYQYIPPHSAHPPHMMRGIIYSLMRNYKLQNTYESDYIKMAKLLFERHVARGWDQGIMKEYILAADYKLRQNPPKLVKPTFEIYGEESNYVRDCFYLPWEFHPGDLPRQGFQQLFKTHLGPVLKEKLGYNRLVVAYAAGQRTA